MTARPDGGLAEVLLVLGRREDGRIGVHLRRTEPPADYGTVELGDLTVLLEAVLDATVEEGL